MHAGPSPNARGDFPQCTRDFPHCTHGVHEPSCRSMNCLIGGTIFDVRPRSHTALVSSDKPIAPHLAEHLKLWEKRERERREQSVIQQKQEGRCSILPMPNVATQPFRTELYTDGLPLFVVDTYRGGSRLFEWELTHPESGEPVVDRVLIGSTFDDPTERGMLHQEHQEIWFHLLKIWNDCKYPVITNGEDGDAYGQIRISAGELVRLLRHNDRSARKYQRIRKLLRDLAQVPICREQHYKWQDTSDRVEFTLLAGVEWRGRRLVPQTGVPLPRGSSEVKILFSSFVTQRFLEHDIKPLLLQPYLQLAGQRTGRRSQLAALLYPKLDRELANKDEYHCRLHTLLTELGVRSYKYKSKRREKVERAVKALNGKAIQNERYTLRVSLRESVDGQDYVLIARRTAQTELPLQR